MMMHPAANEASHRPAVVFLGTPYYPELIEATHQRGYAYLAIGQRLSVAQAMAVDGAVACSLDDAEAVRDALTRMAGQWALCGIVSLNEYRVEAAAEFARSLDLVYPRGIANLRRKHELRALLSKAGLPAPRYATFNHLAEVTRLLQTMALPVVVKPTADSGSRHVTLCHTPEETQDAATAVLRSPAYTGPATPPYGLMEEFIPGPEYSIEGYVHRGRIAIVAMTEKRTTPGPQFVELQHIVPGRAAPDAANAIERTVIRALQVLGVDNVVFHAECRWHVEHRQPYIIEINPRPAGDRIPDLVRATTGLDLRTAALAIALGETPEQGRKPPTASVAGIRFFHADRAGVVRRTRTVQDLRIQQVHWYGKAGQHVGPTTDNFSRLGYVMASASTYEEVEAVLTSVEDTFCIATE